MEHTAQYPNRRKSVGIGAALLASAAMLGAVLANPGLAQGYTNYADYTARFAVAKADAVRKGWLLKEDAATLRPRGKPADFR